MPRTLRLALLVAALTSFTPTFAQNQPTQPSALTAATLNAQAMQALRSGRWDDAIAAAQQVIADTSAPASDRAEAFLHLAAARQRQKNPDAVRAALDELDKLLPNVDADHWIHREAAALRAELAGRPRQEPAKPQKPDPNTLDLGAALWQMRYANSNAQWADAVNQADAILARPGLSRDITAEALLHLYAARRHLNDGPAAALALERFNTIAPTLADRSLALQMTMLRVALGDDATPNEPFASSYKPEPDPYWTSAAPGEVQLDEAALIEVVTMAQRSGADAILIARGGRIAAEWYSPLYREPIATMSSVKSITGLLAGLLVADGKLNVDDPVSKFIPSWSEGIRARVTIRHLLTMTAGLPKRTDMGVAAPGSAGYNAYVINLEPAWEPGTKWAYSNEGAQLLSPILERAAGEDLWAYAQHRLFEPMGLTHTAMRRDNAGNTSTYADAQTNLRELAKFGRLALNRGRWNDRAVLPEAWITEMTTPCLQKPGYGYLWWLYQSPRVWAMEGYLNTSVWAFPDLDIVIARAQRTPYLHATETFDSRKMFALISRAAEPPSRTIPPKQSPAIKPRSFKAATDDPDAPRSGSDLIRS